MSRRLRKRQAVIEAKHYRPQNDDLAEAFARIAAVPLPPPVDNNFEFQELEDGNIFNRKRNANPYKVQTTSKTDYAS